MGILAVAAAGSSRLPAQQAPPAAQTSSNPANVKPNKVSTAEKDENEFRHAPMVQTLARVLNLKVETTARIFEYLNFAIIGLAILVPLLRILPKVMRKRSQALRHDLDSARKLTEEAKTRLSAVEARLSKLDEEIAAIRAEVENEAKHDEARIKSTIAEESQRIVASAEQEIAAAAAHARRGLRHFAADIAIEQAAKQLVLTAETDRALIAEFVTDVAKGDQN